MATEILASGSATAQSTGFALLDGQTSNLILKTEAGAVVSVDVQIEDSTGWVTVGQLTSAEPVKALSGPGTFRVSRVSSSWRLSVDRE